MTIEELKELIKDVPNDFEFEVEVSKRRTEAELKESSYPYPYKSEICKTDNRDYDIGWSEKKMKIDIRITEL
jgi:hypothetical protein